MKKILFALSAVAILSGAGASMAHAQTAPTDSTDCTPTAAELANIKTIENDPTLTAGQELTQELALRKQLLSEVLSCATNEAQALQAQVTSISTQNGGAGPQTQLLGKITDALNFYANESAQVSTAGIKGTESIAKETLAWRTANYIPLEEDANDLLLWSQNQTLFQTAENRFTQTERVVAFIEAAAANNDLQASLGAAQTSLENAEGQNAAAESSLEQFQSPDQSLALIQQSLQSLADTYQKFTDLNNLIQTLLPTSTS